MKKSRYRFFGSRDFFAVMCINHEANDNQGVTCKKS